jgi:hypothetical protein
MGGKKKKGKKPFMDWIFTNHAMWNESDRACPLIGCEALNDRLDSLLRETFAREGLNSDLRGRLLDSFTSPLYSFGMKITMCRAFGVLAHEVCDLLDSLRLIRNHCAHHPRIVSLDDIEITEEVRVIREFVKRIYGYKQLHASRQSLELAVDYLDDFISKQAKKATESTPRQQQLDRPPTAPQPPKKAMYRRRNRQ